MRILVTAIADEANIRECIYLRGNSSPILYFEVDLRCFDSRNQYWSTVRHQLIIKSLCDVKQASRHIFAFETDLPLKKLPDWNCHDCHWKLGELHLNEIKKSKDK